MSNFEHRLTAIHKRPSLGPRGEAGSPTSAAPGDVVVVDESSSLGWQAAERISRIYDVAPGTVIKLVIESGADSALLEVSWDADGIPMIREL
jgi:hypothetical protein